MLTTTKTSNIVVSRSSVLFVTALSPSDNNHHHNQNHQNHHPTISHIIYNKGNHHRQQQDQDQDQNQHPFQEHLVSINKSLSLSSLTPSRRQRQRQRQQQEEPPRQEQRQMKPTRTKVRQEGKTEKVNISSSTSTSSTMSSSSLSNDSRNDSHTTVRSYVSLLHVPIRKWMISLTLIISIITSMPVMDGNIIKMMPLDYFHSYTVASAACLPGDLSKECIGVYKVPTIVDENVLPYVSTPEALQRYAPDINYVPPIPVPKNEKQAWEIFQTQRIAADDIKQVVLEGKLEEAGIKVLNLLPKVTSSGKTMLQYVSASSSSGSSSSSGDGVGDTGTTTTMSSINDIRYTQMETQFELVYALWNECDVMIGQALRGELGNTSAVAQIQILSTIRDAIASMDDFISSYTAYAATISPTR